MAFTALFARIYESRKMEWFNRPSRTTFALSIGVLVAFIELSIISIVLQWPTLSVLGIITLTSFAIFTSSHWHYARHRNTAAARIWAGRTASECWKEVRGISRASDESSD